MKYLDFTDLLDGEPANLALLSTYQFDPDFFERRLLRCSALAKARRILIFLDARQWYNLLRQDAPARFLNRRYLMVPVHRLQGVFHPKLNLLLTEQGGQVLCGSNNLTRSGCSSNLELLNAFTFGGEGDSEEKICLAQEAFRFFRRACDDGEEEPARIGRAWLDESAKSVPWLTQPLPVNDGRRVRLLHTYEGSLWDRLAAFLDAAHPSRLLVISPFHDKDGEMFQRVQERWPDCRVEVIVQQQITNLPVKALKRLQPSVSLSELRNSERRLHAKLVAWEGKGGTGCLVGSANFTTAAFDARNVETCLQVTDAADSVRSLFDKDLPKRTIAFEDFEPGAEQEPGPGEGPITGLKMTSALLSERVK
ncbi:MAG: phospholipase D-like domain-containing protein [Gemmataceae bacterium]